MQNLKELVVKDIGIIKMHVNNRMPWNKIIMWIQMDDCDCKYYMIPTECREMKKCCKKLQAYICCHLLMQVKICEHP